MNLPGSALLLDSRVDEDVVIYDRAQIIRSTVLENSVVGEDCRVESCTLLGKNYINRRNMLSQVTLGKYSYMGYNNVVRKVSVGRFCSLAWNISIGGMNHEIDHGSTYTTMWWDRILSEHTSTELPGVNDVKPGIIGNDVWIGSGATILYGVNIGDGAVIGACALVNRDVPPYTVVAGVPARPIGQRFDGETIAALRYSQWWNLPLEGLRAARPILEQQLTPQNLTQLLGLCARYGVCEGSKI